jgi:hypothetical protein
MLAIEESASSLLRPRNARHAIHGENGGLLGRELLEQIRVLGRPNEADQRAAFAQEPDLLGRRTSHLENDIGNGPQLAGRLDNLRTRGLIAFVAEISRPSGTRLHLDGEA